MSPDTPHAEDKAPAEVIDASAAEPRDGGPRVVALVLAAGRGSRFGSDKRLACLPDGRRLLCATLDSIMPYFAATYVVLRHEDMAQALGLPEGIGVVHASHAREGMGASMADAIRSVHDLEFDAAAIVLGDMPWIMPGTLQLLLEHASPGRIVRPVHKGRGGHPVLFGREFWTTLSALGEDEGARGVLDTYGSYVDEIEVNDPGIWRDVDQPEDLTG